MGDPRAEALEWAEQARTRREQLRRQLSEGEWQLGTALAGAEQDPLVGRVRVLFVLESLPGARKTDTRRALAQLGIDGTRPLADLDATQRSSLLRTFAAGDAA